MNMNALTPDPRPQTLAPGPRTPDPRLAGFTLIEMLTVCAIIAILVGVLYPALRTIREGPKKAKAKADMRKFETALQNYYNEYGKWPPLSGFPSLSGDRWVELIHLLNGNRDPYTGGAATATVIAMNPRGVQFMEFDKKDFIANPYGDNSKFILADPWGTPYLLIMDNGRDLCGPNVAPSWWSDIAAQDSIANDGQVPHPYRRLAAGWTPIKKPIAAYSFGPNKTDDYGRGPEYDDIASWY